MIIKTKDKIHNKKEIDLTAKIKLNLIRVWIKALNFLLNLISSLFFKRKDKDYKNIVVYKLGNIGDIICAIPSFIAIRRNYPEAKITLLTSPGDENAPSAKDLLENVWYIDELKTYYSDDINSINKGLKFFNNLRNNNYDLFIQLPDHAAKFRTMFRNISFVKFLGIPQSFGFNVSKTKLFKKTQVKHLFKDNEVIRLIKVLEDSGIEIKDIEFDYNINEKIRDRSRKIIDDKWPNNNSKIIAVGLGGKKNANRWPTQKFIKVLSYLQEKHNIKIIIVGGQKDIEKSEIVKKELKEDDVLIIAGKLSLLETIELFKECHFIISNNTGTIHMASSVDLPSIGLYNIRNAPGTWFPYGNKNLVVYNRDFDCDYNKESCILRSMENIQESEVIEACNIMFNNLNRK